jgi:Ca-activated chloride channel family protein
VNENGATRPVTQPVELPSGWEAPVADGPAMMLAASFAPVMDPQQAPPGGLRPGGLRPGPPSIAPIRAQAASPKTFAAVPSSVQRMRAGRSATPAGAAPSIGDIRLLAAVEARRLAEAETLLGYERREFLDDLVARLKVLLEGLTGAEYDQLRELLAYLGGGGDLAARWARAREVLAAFGGDAGGEPGGRTAFWKR